MTDLGAAPIADTLTRLAAGHANRHLDDLMPWHFNPAVG